MKKTLLFFVILFAALITNTQAQTISVGGHQSYAICPGGTVQAWGNNTFGALGNDTTTKISYPITIKGLSNIIAIAAGEENHCLALKNNGTVWAWGANNYGQLGIGSIINSATPVQVQGVADVTAIAAGGFHSLAIKTDSTVWAWGYNYFGQIGDGSDTDRLVPVKVKGLSGIIAIATGEDHSIALKSDGTVWTWGWNSTGQLGNGSNLLSTIPVKIDVLTGTTAISAGWQHSMAIKNDTVYTWGFNSYGQLGKGDLSDINTPVKIAAFGNVKAIQAASVNSYALLKDGTVRAAGYGLAGQLGNGYDTASSMPVDVKTLANVTAIAGGWNNVLAISNNYLSAWGSNDFGQLGDGTRADRNIPIEVQGLCAEITGLESSSVELTLAVYPNPGNGIFTLPSGTNVTSTLHIYNMVGESIYTSTFPGNTQIDIRNQPKGVYFYLLQNGNQVIGKGKIILE